MARCLIVITLALAAGCAQDRTGVLVMAHGGDPEWNREVEATVAPLQQTCPTEIAFGMATPSTMEAAIQRLESRGVRRIKVVRMFVSGESFVEPTEYILGLRSDLPADPHAGHAMTAHSHEAHEKVSHEHDSAALASDTGQFDAHASHSGSTSEHHMESPRRIQTRAAIVMSRDGVADSPLIDQILADRVRALSKDPAKESVLILGHGPGEDDENQRWLAKMTLRSQGIRQVGAFRRVQCETLREDWPDKRADAEKRIWQFVEDGNRDSGRVIVVPFRVAGFGPYKEVLDGLTYFADERGFCPHPNMTRWIRETASEMPASP
ncbi:MAG: hypothetical protein HZA51_14775 [Planctomycetes bacterium]|nr:hypothetical protein [Planctomycetota bacterium]